MPNYDIGSLIKRLRKQKGLTQEELAYPLIDRATLSRIESGKAMPSKKTMEALLEKLGFHASNTADFFLDAEMTEIQKIHNEIDTYLATRQLDPSAPLIARVDTLVAQLEGNDIYMQNELNQQYVKIVKASNAINKQVDSNTIREILMDAIKISIPQFDEQHIEDYHLSKQDIKIINLLTIIYQDEGESDKAIDMLYGLKHNYDKHCIDKVELGRNYSTIIHNLVIQLYYADRNEEAIELCDIGSKVCKDTRSLYNLPLITLVKAYCLQELGEEAESIRLARQTYHTFDMFGLYQLRDQAKAFAKDTFGIDL